MDWRNPYEGGERAIGFALVRIACSSMFEVEPKDGTRFSPSIGEVTSARAKTIERGSPSWPAPITIASYGRSAAISPSLG
jgi:hypothetical protein